jgi:hypothetical protein
LIAIRDACRRYSLIYTGAIADVLDEMGYRNKCLPSSIQGLTMDSRVAGAAMTIEGQATSSVDLEEIYIPVLKMLGDIRPGDVMVSQPNDIVSALSASYSSAEYAAALRNPDIAAVYIAAGLACWPVTYIGGS